MAEEFQIDIRGIEATCENLTRLPKLLAERAHARALAAAAVPVVDAVRQRVPVALKAAGWAHRIGSLYEALMSVISVDANGAGGVAQIGFGKFGFVARMVEFGHRMVGHRPKDISQKRFREDRIAEQGAVRPYPFMGPAAVASAEASVQAYADSLRESLDDGSVLPQASEAA